MWISPEEMFEHAGRNKSGNERHAAQAKTTLGKVNLVVDTWPIKAYVIDRIKYLLFLNFMFHLLSQNPWAKVRRGFEHADPQNPLAPKNPLQDPYTLYIGANVRGGFEHARPQNSLGPLHLIHRGECPRGF